jgi:hypothetical protein
MPNILVFSYLDLVLYLYSYNLKGSSGKYISLILKFNIKIGFIISWSYITPISLRLK